MNGSFHTNDKNPARQQRAIQAPVLAGREGTGAKAAFIAAVLDPLLDAQIQAEASVAGSLAAQQINLQNAGACLNEPIRFSDAPNGLNGLAADLSKLFDSFQTLSVEPANLPLRRSVVRNAQEVAAQFNRAASRLNGLKYDLNISMQKDVIRANQNLNDIAGLNRQIMEVQAAGGTSGPLSSQRKQYLETLSGFVNITATPQTDGGINVSIGGVTMISGAETPDHLATYADKEGNLRIQTQNSETRLKLTGGAIAGKIAARDGGLAGLQHRLDVLASQLITRVNSVYNFGCDLSGGIGDDFFTGTDASDIGVNSTVANDPLQLRTGGAAALALAKLRSRNVSDLDNQTFGQSYAQTVSELGNILSDVNDDLSSSQAVMQMLANERAAARGVSLDAAMVDLKQYEQACASSAKMIAALDEMRPMR